MLDFYNNYIFPNAYPITIFMLILWVLLAINVLYGLLVDELIAPKPKIIAILLFIVIVAPIGLLGYMLGLLHI